MKKIFCAIVAVAALAFLFSMSESVQSSRNIPVQLVSPDGAVQIAFSVEVADDPFEQTRGLQHRTELPDGTGMLFVFPADQPLSFWMKETLIPLDVLYFTQEGDFVRSYRMDPCTKDPCANYPSLVPARMALEVNAGVVEKEGIGPGWRLVLQ